MNKDILWVDRLENLIQEKHMLLHPFYQAWMQGSLTQAALQTYVKEYYQHIKAFPTYISALHSRCNDLNIRKHLLTNLIDEEDGFPNHPDLWRVFAHSVGVNAEDLETHQPNPVTQNLIRGFRTSCSSKPWVVGLAALYSYESQIPAICQTKIDGLQKWHGLTDPESYRYFSVHATVDIEHSFVEKQILLSLVRPEEEEAVIKGADCILSSLGHFLSSVYI